MLTRLKITIPAAGLLHKVEYGGFGIITEKVNQYTSPEEVPLVRIGDINKPGQPIYAQSKYTGQAGNYFEAFWIEGTPESAGDDLWLLVSDQPVTAEILNDPAAQFIETLSATYYKDVGSVVRSFSESELYLNGRRAVYALFSDQGQGYDFLYSFGSDPIISPQPYLGYLVPEVGNITRSQGSGYFKIEGFEALRDMKWVDVAGDNGGKISVTIFYK